MGGNGSSGVSIHVESRGKGQAIHILTVKQMCSVVETCKGLSQELVKKSGSVSIYVKGRGAPGTMGRANCALVTRWKHTRTEQMRNE